MRVFYSPFRVLPASLSVKYGAADWADSIPFICFFSFIISSNGTLISRGIDIALYFAVHIASAFHEEGMSGAVCVCCGQHQMWTIILMLGPVREGKC